MTPVQFRSAALAVEMRVTLGDDTDQEKLRACLECLMAHGFEPMLFGGWGAIRYSRIMWAAMTEMHNSREETAHLAKAID